MFFFLFGSYNLILIAAAVIPAVFLMIKIYKSDRLEPEPPRLIGSLVLLGILATFCALVGEMLGSLLLRGMNDTLMHDLIMYYLVVAGCEEGFKYFFMRRRTWRLVDFNCQYDGVVYAVAISLGFALWENISYVYQYGVSTALIRAVTAVPGHACFGVFMGAWYGMARREANLGNYDKSRLDRLFAVLIPMLLHGTYDFIATRTEDSYTWIFLVFVAVLFFISFKLIKNLSANDRYIG